MIWKCTLTCSEHNSCYAWILKIGLARIFHTDRDEEAAKADGVRQASILMQGCMCTYCPNQNGSLTQHPSDFSASLVDQYEISGLARLSYTGSSQGAVQSLLVLGGRRIGMPGCRSPYCPSQNRSLTQYPPLLSGFCG